MTETTNVSSPEKQQALRQLERRRKNNAKLMKDNSRLYAGSAMYYYCRHCNAETDVLPETWSRRDYPDGPRKICADCEKLVQKGFLS